ncbi:nuclear mRNA splicing factor-associated protein [Penicillium bovifimosum]|uniref:Nuclear mRNA splicing factor-associated protein n=1 Tax=Penicillium bovifimosum TaxID=126998 RepID=A0A9W9H1P3_9EURO|nr:nuclear mRNA splicing factor-associated protein [Penicillium bovifimosum]KAJ5135201.1 nuclear mRNA splicing factor-associated protein [Penicillium bovifimosum]
MGFPTDPATFEQDDRISWSKADNCWILETDDREFQYDTALKRWVENIDEDLIRQQQQTYQFKGVTETEATHPRERKQKKRKEMQEQAEEQPKAKKQRANTAVWVTSIPLDATLDEIHATFAKYGMLAEELDTGKPRIKMYNDDDGNFKGDALVVYYRPESVNLAINMLDDTDFRMGIPDPSGKKMQVQEADFAYKREQTAPTKMSRQEKKKIQELREKMERRLAEWSDDEQYADVKRKPTESDKHMVLKHMFTLKELEDDPTARLDIEEDIREEASKIGEVTKVVLYDEEPEGIVKVRFTDPAAAVRCAKAMNGRKFSGSPVVAYIWDGKEKFRKYNARRAEYEKTAAMDSGENDEAEIKRLEKFGAWLESDKTQPQNKTEDATPENRENDQEGGKD